jgi:hypothetical protein
VSGNHGTYDAWVVKVDGSGNLIWQKCLGGSFADYAEDIQRTTDGGYIIAGYTNSNNGDVSGNHGSYDAWVVKVDDSGNLIWQKCLGGSGNDYAYFIRQTADGGYIVAGSTSSSGNGDLWLCYKLKGGSDFWIAKLDGSGSIQWQKSFGGTGDESAYSILPTADGSYIVGGSTVSNNGNVSGNHGGVDFWIMKMGVNPNP